VTQRQKFRLKLPTRLKLPNDTLVLGERTLIMGVLNITPDSFSDGGNFLSREKAVQHAMQMERDGAHLIDIGAESTRPGAHELSAEEEWRRLAPVLSALRKRLKIPISIDTRKSEIAQRAVDAGAAIINDVSGLHYDSRISQVAAQARVPLILMHMRGEPLTMQQKPFARDVIKDVLRGLGESVAIARKAGVARSQIIVDPGIGFGKSWAQNYELLQKLPELAKLKFPLLVGPSRKGFIGRTLAMHGKPASAEMKIWGTAATVTASILNGAHIVRVHDVAEMSPVARIADCILNPRLAPKP
jgi:dihydropteroate synthase